MTCDDVRDLAPAYVLGAVEAAEAEAVRDHLGSCPEAHEELAELGGVVPHLAEAVVLVEPPASLRGRIMAAAAADFLAPRPAAAAAIVPGLAPLLAPDGGAVPAGQLTGGLAPLPTGLAAVPAMLGATPDVMGLPPNAERQRARTMRASWVAALAAVLAIAVLGVWNIRLQADLGTAQADRQRAEQALAVAQVYQRHVDEVLAIARIPGATVAVLTGAQPGTNSGIVAVGPDGKAAMVVSGLPATTGAGVYEVWVIVGSNAPRPVGELIEAGGIAYMTGTTGPVPSGAIVALTREAGPGATKPTLPIVSKGVAAASS